MEKIKDLHHLPELKCGLCDIIKATGLWKIPAGENVTLRIPLCNVCASMDEAALIDALLPEKV